jgi:hypothetical protein
MSKKKYKDLYDFESLFYADIEKWFSADIACCDNCYNDFITTWPLAYSANDAEFQKCSIDLETFYDGSRIRDIYSKDEFNYFIKTIKCPRCGTPLNSNIWPYKLPFEKDNYTESLIDELAAIAAKTPFLLLKHPYSIEVLATIKSISKSTKSTVLNTSLFRARLSDIPNPKSIDFSFPPKEYVKEGRYNHAGITVLYLASDKKTCFYEMREKICTIAEIKINRKIKILDFINVDNYQYPYDNIIKSLVYSALLSSKQEDKGWYKPKYIFSRFLADCALESGFQAIKYPSTRLSMSNYNLVILDSSLTNGKDYFVVHYYKVRSIKDI